MCTCSQPLRAPRCIMRNFRLRTRYECVGEQHDFTGISPDLWLNRAVVVDRIRKSPEESIAAPRRQRSLRSESEPLFGERGGAGHRVAQVEQPRQLRAPVRVARQI